MLRFSKFVKYFLKHELTRFLFVQPRENDNFLLKQRTIFYYNEIRLIIDSSYKQVWEFSTQLILQRMQKERVSKGASLLTTLKLLELTAWLALSLIYI